MGIYYLTVKRNKVLIHAKALCQVKKAKLKKPLCRPKTTLRLDDSLEKLTETRTVILLVVEYYSKRI